MAKLPPELTQRKIKDMSIGGMGYAVPWAMYVGPDDELYLHGNWPIRYSSCGTVQMKISRTKKGFNVDVRNVEYYRWRETPQSWSLFSLKVEEISYVLTR